MYCKQTYSKAYAYYTSFSYIRHLLLGLMVILRYRIYCYIRTYMSRTYCRKILSFDHWYCRFYWSYNDSLNIYLLRVSYYCQFVFWFLLYLAVLYKYSWTRTQLVDKHTLSNFTIIACFSVWLENTFNWVKHLRITRNTLRFADTEVEKFARENFSFCPQNDICKYKMVSRYLISNNVKMDFLKNLFVKFTNIGNSQELSKLLFFSNKNT